MAFDSLPHPSRSTDLIGPGEAETAGIVILRRFGPEWSVLLLRAEENWDLPKGGVNPGESTFEAAIRETAEESGITELNFEWGMVSTIMGGTTEVFMASTTQDAAIQMNPTSGLFEHVGWAWIDLSQAGRIMEDYYLAPVFERVMNVIWEDERWQ